MPSAALDIYYSWESVRKHKPELAKHLDAKLEELKDANVRYLGGVSQPVLHAALRGAAIWAYPTSGVAETFCILATSALASGCVPVVPNAGALRETLGEYAMDFVVEGLDDSNIDTDEGKELFIRQLVRELKNPASLVMRRKMRKYALDTYSWDAVARGFLGVLERIA